MRPGQKKIWRLCKLAKKSRRYRENQQRQRTLGVIVVSVAALLVIIVLLVLSRSSDSDKEPAAAQLDTGVVDSVGEAAANLTAEGYPYRGSPDAPVKMIEYSDYFCGHCATFALEKAPQIEEEYVATGKVQYIAQYYALGLDARLSIVEASACAADQGRFFEYQRALFVDQQKLGATPVDQWGDLLSRYAQQLGLDMATFDACWEQTSHREQILTSIDDARQKGVGGTPAFLINGELLVGNQPYEQFQAVIEEALAEATQ